MDNISDGVIVGGWGYVWAGYAITWLTIILYGLSLYLREREEVAPPAEPPMGEPS